MSLAIGTVLGFVFAQFWSSPGLTRCVRQLGMQHAPVFVHLTLLTPVMPAAAWATGAVFDPATSTVTAPPSWLAARTAERVEGASLLAWCSATTRLPACKQHTQGGNTASHMQVEGLQCHVAVPRSTDRAETRGGVQLVRWAMVLREVNSFEYTR